MNLPGCNTRPNGNVFKPYKKENTEIRYINKNSNHPKIIKKNLSAMVEKRLIKLSKNKNIFDDNICTYQNALDKSNFKFKLAYKPLDKPLELL